MGDYYNYNTDTGVITVDTETLKTDVQGEFKEALGSNLELNDSTPQGRMIDGETAARAAVLAFAASVANQINPELSGGVFINSIFTLMGGEAYKATPTILNNVRIYASQLASAPADMKIYDEQGNFFRLQTTTPINILDPATSTFFGLGTFQALVPGPTVIAANTRWLIAQPVPDHVTSVVNTVAGITGLSQESDVTTRNRRRDTLAKQNKNSVRAVRALVSDLPGFRSIFIRDNDAAAQQVIDGITMPANKLYVCVQGAVDTDIAAAMLEAKAGGQGWTAGTPVRGTEVSITLVEPASKQEYTVVFTRPDVISCTCRVQYDPLQSTGNYEPQFAIQDAINQYQNGQLNSEPGLVIARNLSAYELAGAIGAVYPGIYVSDLTVTGKTVVDGEEVVINGWEVADIPIGGVVVEERTP